MSWNGRMARTLDLATAMMLACSCAADAVPAGESAADRALADFDRDNPDCELWTNWEKMCSRTGRDGATYCVTDPEMPVEASEPFCTDSSVGYYANRLSPAQTASVLRFCQDTFETEQTDPRTGKVLGRVTNCRVFQPDRPFSGRRIAARLHPWCEEWSDSKTREVVCAVNPQSDGVADCRRPSLNPLRTHRLYCTQLAKPDWCAEARDFYDFDAAEHRMIPSEELTTTEDRIFFTDQVPLAAPVYGIKCERRKE